MFKDLNIVVGITGGIAAYKACGIVSFLKSEGANVDVIMTKNACEFITPLTLETLSGNKVVTDMFERPDYIDVKHISLARKADLFLIVPATANIIGKVANGIADDMLSTTIMFPSWFSIIFLYALSYFIRFEAMSMHPCSVSIYLSVSLICFDFITDSGKKVARPRLFCFR